MHVLAIIAIPAIVLTSLIHSAGPAVAPPPRLVVLSEAERARIVAAQRISVAPAWIPDGERPE